MGQSLARRGVGSVESISASLTAVIVADGFGARVRIDAHKRRVNNFRSILMKLLQIWNKTPLVEDIGLQTTSSCRLFSRRTVRVSVSMREIFMGHHD